MFGSRFASMIALAALIVVFGCGQKATPAAAPSASDVTEFDSAVRDGDTSIVSRLLKAKPEMVNAKDESGKTPVTIATEKSDTDMVNLLKKHGGHE